jgi:hypothetical protein
MQFVIWSFLKHFFETRSYYVAQADLKLLILLSPPPEHLITSVHHHTWFFNLFIYLILAVLEFDLTALQSARQHSIIWAMPAAHFALVLWR